MGKDQRSSCSDHHGSEKDQISINQQENALKEEEEARHEEISRSSSSNASFKAAKESQESDMEMLKKRLEDVECSENNEKKRLQDRHEGSKHGMISSSSDDHHDSDKKMSGDQESSRQEANVIKEDRKARLHQELVILGGLNASDNKSAKELQELVESCKQDGEVLKKLLGDDTEKYTQDERNSLQEAYEEWKLYEEGLKHVTSIFAEENRLMMMHDGEDDQPGHVILMLHGKPWKEKLQIVCHSFKKMMEKIDRMLSLKESAPNQQNIQDSSKL